MSHQRAVELYGTVFPGRKGDTVDDIRLRFDALLGTFALRPGTDVLTIDAGGVPARAVTADGARTDSVLLWFHGGGYSIGSAAGYTEFASALSAACGVTVIVPDYRLAPEHPFPAAADDAVTVADWVAGAYGEHAIGGDSAGSALALLSARGGAVARSRPRRLRLLDLSASTGRVSTPRQSTTSRYRAQPSAWCRRSTSRARIRSIHVRRPPAPTSADCRPRWCW